MCEGVTCATAGVLEPMGCTGNRKRAAREGPRCCFALDKTETKLGAGVVYSEQPLAVGICSQGSFCHGVPISVR